MGTNIIQQLNFTSIASTMNHREDHEDDSILSATPFGPIFKTENITLRQALYINNTNRRFKLLTTFVPDEVIYCIEKRKKTIDYDVAAILLIDLSDVYGLFEDFLYSQNGGTSCFTAKLDMFLNVIIEQVYYNKGDVITFSDYCVLSLWKNQPNEFVHDLLRKVIGTCFEISDKLDDFKTENVFVRSSIAVGKVAFSIIGTGSNQSFSIYGEPVEEVKNAVKLSSNVQPVLPHKTWEYCVQADYVAYAFNSQYVQVIRERIKRIVVDPCDSENDKPKSCRVDVDLKVPSVVGSLSKGNVDFIGELSEKYDRGKVVGPKCMALLLNLKKEREILNMRQTLIDNCKTMQLGLVLRNFISFPVVNQIENDSPLDQLTQIRCLTIVAIDVQLNDTVKDQIRGVNKCYHVVLLACKHIGCVMNDSVKIENKKIGFRLCFGLTTHLKNFNHCRSGIQNTFEMLGGLQKLNVVEQVSVSISTGNCCCTVAGHVARRYYAFIGSPMSRVENMILFSRNKIMCDMESLVFSGLKKSNFQPHGLVNFRGNSGKGYTFGFYDRNLDNPALFDVRFAYPLLGRFHELEVFRDILDDIGLEDRTYSGILIEGNSRLGKSRLLDAFCALAKTRQIKVAKVALTPFFVPKPYAVINEILKQILGLGECKTIDECQKRVSAKLAHFVPETELCYMNRILCVQFKLSKQFIHDSDWSRHKKCLQIFEKILKKYYSPRCIFLDNIQLMDYMSWQFLSQALNSKNVVAAMTLLEVPNFDEMSRIEMELTKDKRLRRQALTGLDSVSMPILVCQLMHVQGICPVIKDFVINSEVTHPGWFEMLFSLINLIHGIEFKVVTVEEAEELGITFPQLVLVTRIPLELLPEDVAPEERTLIPVCIATNKFRIIESYILYDIKALGVEIYHRMSPYEQQVVMCASVLGRVFKRDVLEKIIPNHQPAKTIKAIGNLMRIRLFECAMMQRNPKNLGDPANFFEPRATFSDMHHLLRCWCQVKPIPLEEEEMVEFYAYCQFLEFRIPAMQYIVYERIPEVVKKDLHLRVSEIFKLEAKRCVSCGGGAFFRIPGLRIKKKRSSSKRTFSKISSASLEDKFQAAKKKVSLRGSDHSLSDSTADGEERKSLSRKLSKKLSLAKTNLSHVFAQSIHEFDPSVKARRSKKIYNSLAVMRLKFKKMSKIHPEETKPTVTPVLRIHNFSYIDFRNCRCHSIISCIYEALYHHLKNSVASNVNMINFLLDYSAALIETGQPAYALKFLNKADQRISYVDRKNYQVWTGPMYMKIIKKSLILSLRGNAFKLLGNYPQAKSNYLEASSLYLRHFSANKLIIMYKTVKKKFRYKIRQLGDHQVTDDELRDERDMMVNQNSAAILSLVSEIYMIYRRYGHAKLASVKSLLMGFSNYDPDNFVDQAELFISMVKVFGRAGDASFIKAAEKCMLFAINQKTEWVRNEDVVMLGKVYVAMFQASMIQGKQLIAILFGGKAIRIAKLFHITRLEFKVLPMLIKALVRVKQISEAMDMLQLLRDDAMEDIDKSALTWYYAICMDIMLETGLMIERYEICAAFAKQILAGKKTYCVSRDSSGLRRLVCGLWMWQLRKGDLSSTDFVKSLNFFLTDFNSDDFAMIMTLCKLLECHLLLLLRCINMKKGSQTEILVDDVNTLMDILNETAKISDGVKPYYFVLKAYFSVLHGCYQDAFNYLNKGKKYAIASHDLMALAWIWSNKKAWKAEHYNNMAQYWEEIIGYKEAIFWHDLDAFDVHDWSNLFYSFPVPDSYL